MKGIVLAGGTGTRLYPVTRGISKQLIPIYDKPLIFYSIATLMLAGVRSILIITTARDLKSFIDILGSGDKFGVDFNYATQSLPNGIADAFIIGREFIGESPCSLILGDNIFFGPGLGNQLKNIDCKNTAHVFAYHVSDPERYGVVEFGKDDKPLDIVEKPIVAKSNYAITGLYFYPNDIVELVKDIRPSSRGELEITDINKIYLKSERLNVVKLPRGTAWLDTGTFTSLIAAANFVKTVEERQGLKIGCLEEIAWRNGWISDGQLFTLASNYIDTKYGLYLLDLLQK